MKGNTEDFWPSVSDLMSGLMMIFLFISISFMVQINKEKEKMQDIAKKYQETKNAIYLDLEKEFSNDLIKWNAVIDKETLSIKFNEPEIFFEQGKSDLSIKFKSILDDFFPRYIKILSSEKYREEIDEVRIEGHTSTEWTKQSTAIDSYFENMKLSQNRTRETLEYIMKLPTMSIYEEFMIKNVTANGLSYSKKLIINGIEDKNKSRRVEFKIRTKAEKSISEILDGDKKNENN